jgi:hypothetical protein
MISTCFIGAFLLATGIDLIVNANRGTSFGLRKLLDENSLHAEVSWVLVFSRRKRPQAERWVQALRTYDPPLSSKLLVGLSVRSAKQDETSYDVLNLIH